MISSVAISGEVDGVKQSNAGDPGPDPPVLFEEGIVEIEIPGIDTRDFVVRYFGDTLYLPYLALCDYLRIPASLSPDNSILEGEFPLGRRFRISALTGEIQVGSDTARMSSIAIRKVNEEIYIEQGALFRALGISARFDLTHLTLRIAADNRIPFVQRFHDMQRHKELGMRSESSRMPDASLQRRLFGGPVVDWRISTMGTSRETGRRASGSAWLHVGGELLYGDVEATLSSPLHGGAGRLPTPHLASWDWRFYLPQQTLLRRISLGTVALDRHRLVGLELSNTPLTPRRGVIEYEIGGRTQPGWTVEMYDGLRLVGVSVADSTGYYGMQVLVGSGRVDRTLRHLGVHGEVIIEQRRLQFHPGMVPPGEVEYELRLGSTDLQPDSLAGAAGRISFGLFDRLTVGVEGLALAPGLHSITSDSLRSSLLANVWLGETGSLLVRYRPVQQFLAAHFSYLPSRNATLRAGFDSLSIANGTLVATMGFTLPAGSVAIGASGRAVVDGPRSSVEVNPRLSGYLAGVNIQASARLAWTHPGYTGAAMAAGEPGSVGVQSSLSLLGSPFPGVLLGSGLVYDHTNRSMEGLGLSAYIHVFEGTGLNLSCSIPRGKWSSPVFRVQVDVGLSPARIALTAAQESNEATVTMLAQGSMRFAGSGVRVSRDPTVGKASIVVRAFHDRNNNGLRDRDEVDLASPTAELFQERVRLISDEGVFNAILPNVPWAVEVDQWTYAAEGLFPGKNRFAMVSAPSAITTIDVPFVEGFDISGTCVVRQITSIGDTVAVPGSPAYGLRVELLSVDNENSYEAEIFSDGSLMISGVGAGRYRVRFDREQVASRHLEHLFPSNEVLLDASNRVIPAIMMMRVVR